MYRELKDSDKEKESGKTVSAALTEESMQGASDDFKFLPSVLVMLKNEFI